MAIFVKNSLLKWEKGMPRSSVDRWHFRHTCLCFKTLNKNAEASWNHVNRVTWRKKAVLGICIEWLSNLCHTYNEKKKKGKKKHRKDQNCSIRKAWEHFEKKQTAWRYLKEIEMKEKVREEHLNWTKNQALQHKSHQRNKTLKYHLLPPSQ